MTQDSRLRTPAGDSAMDETNDAIRVNVITGTGLGGTQYTEGDTDTSITGTAMLMEGATSTLVPAQGTAADGLLVNLGTNNDVTVTSGTITGITNAVAVTGTFWQATQPVSGTFWQATQPISAASLPLPSGAATSTLQGGGLPAALGAGGGLKVDGSGTALPVSLASVPSHAVTNAGAFAVQASLESGSIYSGTTAMTPKFALANVAASQTDSNIVTGVTNKKIRVLSAIAVAGATATALTFNTKPAGAGSAISCLFANAANGGFVLPFSPVGWFETASGDGLTVTTGAGSTTGIQVCYVEV